MSDRTGFHKNAKGQGSVEFVLTALFLILLIFAIIELMIMIHAYNVLADSAKEGLRYAIVHGTGVASAAQSGPTCPCAAIDGSPAPPGTYPGYRGTGLTIYGVVKTYAQYSFHDTSKMTVTVTYPDTTPAPANQPGGRVQIKVSYPYQPLFGLGWPTVTLNAAAEGRIIN